MERFSALYEELASTNLDHAKVEALTAYFRGAAPEDAAWAVFFLTGQRIKRLVSSATLRAWAT